MNKIKAIISLIISILILSLPMSAFAAPAEPIETIDNSSYYLNLKCTIDGKAPQKGNFTFSVIKYEYSHFNNEIEDVVGTDEFVVSAKECITGKKYPFKAEDMSGNFAFEFKLTESSESGFSLDPLTVLVIFTNYKDAESGDNISLVKTETALKDIPVDVFVDEPANITFNCKPAPALKISTKDCEPINKIYDGTVKASLTDKNYKLLGLAKDHDVKLSAKSSVFNSSNVKDANKVTVTGLSLIGKDADKYSLNSASFECKGTITPRPVEVTADNCVISQAQNNIELTYTLSEELLPGNKKEGSLERVQGNSQGKYKITKGSLSFGDNYNIIFKEGTLTISDFGNNEISDDKSSIKISGYIDKDAVFSASALDPNSEAYNLLVAKTSGSKIISSYEILLDSNMFDGEITIAFPIDKKYNGGKIVVYQRLANGAVASFDTEASDGIVRISTNECTQFMITAIDNEHNIPHKPSVGKTVLKTVIIILSVIIGFGLLTALVFFGMIFFNKTEQLKSIIIHIKHIFKKKKDKIHK